MGLFGGSGGFSLSPSSPFGGAALSGLGSAFMGPVGGAAVGNYLGSAAQQEANKQNHQMSLEMFNLNKKETDTAHQRQVKDLRAAGLNPILSAGGSGASSASGAASRSESTMKGMANLGATAQAAQQTKAAIANTEQDTANKVSTNTLTSAQIETEAARKQQTLASAKAQELDNINKEQNLPNEAAKRDYEKRQMEIDKNMQEYDNTIRRIHQTGGAIGSAVSSVIPRLGKLFTDEKGAMSKLPKRNYSENTRHYDPKTKKTFNMNKKTGEIYE